MALSAGSTLGAYEILSPLGSGGMGEVYRARDTKLGRSVAIKVLPEEFVFDPDRIARFEREAKVLASLNHPHIAALLGMEMAGGRHFLIMELVEGETLAERLRRGAMRVEQALQIAIQIADALEGAHEKSVIHRDLKPANVKITPDDQVKVLDFGLAKAMDTGGHAIPDVTHSPTLSMMGTQAGMILGTAAYMAPEQAKGSPADHRSDVFSFGSVLYEMLTGGPPFQGDSAPEILASVLAREPDFTRLPPALDPRVPEVLKRCLEKSPRRRWQAVGDLRAELESIAAATGHGRASVSPASPRAAGWRRAIAPAGAAVVVAALSAAGFTYFRPVPAAPVVTRFSLAPLPAGLVVNFGNPSFAISPDGTHIVYVTPMGLYVRSMSEFNGRLIVPAGRTTIINPIFSPDGQSIAFAADGALKRVPLTGGTPFTIAPLPSNHGLSWEGDHIVFGGTSAIRRVTTSGGVPEPVVPLQPGEWGWGPRVLSGGNWIMFTAAKGLTPEHWDKGQIVAQSVSSGERRILVEDGRDARYTASGHLVFARGGVLLAAPFDAERVELTGPPTPMVDGVRRSAINGTSHFSVSETGTLIYLPGPTGLGERRVEVVIADRIGAVERVSLPPGPYDHPRVSRDGRLLVFGTTSADQNIWIYDLAGSSAARRLTFGGSNRFPIWSADGRRVVFQSDRDGAPAVYWQAADGSGPPERLTMPESATAHIPETWLPGQDGFLFSVVKESKRTLWTFSVGDRTSDRFDGVETADAVPRAVAVSPDGKWIVYVASDIEANRTSGIFVQPVPPTGATYQVSEQIAGQQPVWSFDGKEIFFVPGGGQLAAVRIGSGPGFTFSKPIDLRRAFSENLAPAYERNYDVTRDGRFIGFVAAGQSDAPLPTGQINVVLNWFEEVKAKVPTP